ncbi:MAG TPA: hypothetical protein EYG98_07125 [Sulfurovum sp.]|nr:hypothetical protein [Sulfurovum sp.]
MTNRKHLLGSVILLLTLTNNMSANDNINTFINANKVKIVSQSLAKNYLYIHQNLQVSAAKLALKKNILSLNQSIKDMQSQTNSKDTQELVEFMFFSSDELNTILTEEFTPENGGLILDYTESLLEGSDLIAKQSISKKDNKNLEMLERVGEMKYLLERAAKYYIAFRAGYTDTVNVEQANSAVQEFSSLLEGIKSHPYPTEIQNGSVKKLLKYWAVSKNFFLGIKKSKLPSIVFISTKHMDAALENIAEYHRKEIK